MAKQFGSVLQPRFYDSPRAVLIIAACSLCLLTSLGSIIFIISTSQASVPVAPAPLDLAPVEQLDDVLIPLRNIQPDVKLRPELFRVERRVASVVPEGSLQNLEQLTGQYSRTLILRGHPLHRDFVTQVKPAEHIRDEIPDGFRAVTIGVDHLKSVEGWAWPGASVDVVWITKVNRRKTLIPIVQNAQILSAGRRTVITNVKGSEVPKTVTLLVTSSDANRVQLAQSTGSLSLNLRGNTDTGKGADTASISMLDLLPGLRRGDSKEFAGKLILGGERYLITDRGKIIPDESGELPLNAKGVDQEPNDISDQD